VVGQLHERISIYDNSGIYRRFEKLFGERMGIRYSLTVNSGTNALLSMYFAIGLEPGDEVIVPAYTFFATATPLFVLGAIPVFADCQDNGNVDPDAISCLVTSRTRAVVITHMWGIPCEMEALEKVCRLHKLFLLQDASHAHGATFRGRPVAGFGHASAWSLQGKKVISAGEGGVFGTENEGLFQRAVLLGHFNRRAKQDVTLAGLRDFATTGVGLNLRMHPLGAALALVQLHDLDRQLSGRRATAAFIASRLAQLPGLRVAQVPGGAEASWYAIPIIFDAEALAPLTKEQFVQALRAEGAEEADGPESTCPLPSYPLFQDPTFIWQAYGGSLERFRADSCQMANAARFHSSVLKIPSWYGTDGMEFARFYADAFEKVISHRNLLVRPRSLGYAGAKH
jgi:dTDP-4-amino-4,6-dideoxygalactose transaminase